MRDLILIGGGEHACVVAEAVHAGRSHRLIGFVDPHPHAPVAALGVPHLGNDDVLEAHRGTDLHLGFAGAGPAPRRSAIAAQLHADGHRFAAITHPHAWLSPTAQVGDGVFIGAGAIVQTGAVLGAHALINTGVIVEHHVRLDEAVQLAPRVVVGGACRIGARTFVGLGAVIRDHLDIGADVMVGMGAVVVGDLPAGVMALGVPARFHPSSVPVLSGTL